jgi:hypothetical protein
MTAIRFLGILILALQATARADLTIVQSVEGAEGLRKIKMEVKGDKARVDVSPQLTTIVDAKSGEVTNLVHERKIVMRIPAENARAMAEMAKSFVKEEVPNQGAPKPTGKKQTIGGYETTEYVTDSPKFHASYWVATTYPDWHNILSQMTVLQKGAFASLTQGMPDYHALPGLPLRTQVKVEGQPEITSTIESVSLAPVSDADFAVPSGYSEVKMPDLSGSRQPPTKPGNP